MSRHVHTVSINDGSSPLAQSDRLGVLLLQLANGVGGGAGQSVAVAVTGLELPAAYNVQATPSQDATVWITGRTQAGFTVNIAPRLAASTLAAGTIDVRVAY